MQQPFNIEQSLYGLEKGIMNFRRANKRSINFVQAYFALKKRSTIGILIINIPVSVLDDICGGKPNAPPWYRRLKFGCQR